MSMIKNGFLTVQHFNRRYFKDFVIKEVVKFVFRSDNAQMLSWETKKIKFGKTDLTLPAILRKLPVEVLYKTYFGEYYEHNKRSYLGRTTFIKIIRLLTKGEVKQKSCIDYMLSTLVHENFKVVREILKRELRCVETSKKFLRIVEAAVDFLKYSFSTHISEESNDPLHNPKFSIISNRREHYRKSHCHSCNSVLSLFRHIQEEIGPCNDQVLEALKEGKKKVELFMGHKHRAYLQEKRISEIMCGLSQFEAGTAAVVFIDYKMKLNPIRHRESTFNWYGQKGMSWHGGAVFYREESKDCLLYTSDAADD